MQKEREKKERKKHIRSHNIINIRCTLQHFPTIEIIIHPTFYCSQWFIRWGLEEINPYVSCS